jgi:dihydropteroate synthase
LKQLKQLETLGHPILVGVSRKSMICRVLDIKPEEALEGTQVIQTLALLNGAKLLRVHDVKPAVQSIQLIKQYEAV